MKKNILKLLSMLAILAPAYARADLTNLKFEGNSVRALNSGGDVNLSPDQATGIVRTNRPFGVGGRPEASALFEVQTTSYGAICAPVMTTAQRDAIASPAKGLQIFNSTTNVPNFYNGSAWTAVGSGGGSGTVTSVTAGTGLTGTPNPIISTGTIALANTAVTPGSFTNANITVDAQGRLTAAASGTDNDTGITQLTGDVTAGPGSGSQAATIAANAVNSAKFRLANATTLRSRNAANSADVDLLFLDAFDITTLTGSNEVLVTAPNGVALFSSDYMSLDASDNITVTSVSGDITVQNSSPGNITINSGVDTLITSQNGDTTLSALTGEVILLGSGLESVNATSRELKDAVELTSYDYSQRQFKDQAGVVALVHTTDSRELKNTSEVTTLDWEAATLRFVSGIVARWGNITSQQSSWGSDFPGIEISGESTAATTAGAAGITLQDPTGGVDLVIATSDSNDSDITADIFQTTGNNTFTSGPTGGAFFGTGSITNAGNADDTGPNSIVTGSTNGTGASGPVLLTPGTAANPDNQGVVRARGKRLDVDKGLRTNIGGNITADPCGNTAQYPEATIFYNFTSKYYCFCNDAGADVQMHAPSLACF